MTSDDHDHGLASFQRRFEQALDEPLDLVQLDDFGPNVRPCELPSGGLCLISFLRHMQTAISLLRSGKRIQHCSAASRRLQMSSPIRAGSVDGVPGSTYFLPQMLVLTRILTQPSREVA